MHVLDGTSIAPASLGTSSFRLSTRHRCQYIYEMSLYSGYHQPTYQVACPATGMSVQSYNAYVLHELLHRLRLREPSFNVNTRASLYSWLVQLSPNQNIAPFLHDFIPSQPWQFHRAIHYFQAPSLLLQPTFFPLALSREDEFSLQNYYRVTVKNIGVLSTINLNVRY